MTGKSYRLLTKAEYEFATRAGTETAHPWGDEVGKNNANCDGCGSQWDRKQTAPVGSFASNQFGLYDMVGNVWEWTEDCHHFGYRGARSDGSAWITEDCPYRVLRGGSRLSGARVLRPEFRYWNAPLSDYNQIGFRVARTLFP